MGASTAGVLSFKSSTVRHVKSMGASTAGVLSFKFISYSQNLVLAKMFWAYFSFINYTDLCHRSYGFSKATPFGVWGGPEKDRDVCFWWWDSTYALPGFVLPA